MPTYEYEGPVEITELPITVKALATRTGYLDSAIATANYTQAKVATPAFTPVAGSYPYPVTVTITCATSGAQIKYSVDGSEPSLDYTVPLTVSGNTPVKAKAVKTNWLDSDVASVVYEQAQVPVVTFTPGSSAVVFPQTVYLATVLSGTTIYYTVGTNPPDPTTSDILYDPDDGVVLVAAGVIKAFAIKSGYIDSDVNSATYSQVQVATPAISQSYSPGGGYWYPNTITLTCATSGSTIRYTVDGSTPTSGSTLYTTPFAITSSVTVKARAFKSGYADSDVATRLYDQQRVTATPTISQSNAESGVPNPTSPLYPTVVTITGEAGSTFYYTVDGSTPTNGSTLYSAPFNNTGQTPVKAIAYKTDYLPSAVATQAYTQRVVVTPTFSHPGGEIVLGSTVSINTTTPNCTIYYTVDGSTPDNTDTVYSGPVTIGSAMTLKAIAYKTGGFQPGSWAVSAVATASYTGPLSPVPVISPNGSGEYELPVKVLITTASAVDSIYYTVDGSTPDNTDTLYTGAFTVSTHGTVVKAISYKAGYTESAVATVTINQATFSYIAELSPAPNTEITDGATVTSTLKWKRTAGGTLTSAVLGSVAATDGLYNMRALRNGKYMICGSFGSDYGASPGYTIKGLVRLNQDMTPDVNWRSTANDFNGLVSDFVELSDGSIVAVGTFTSINGATRNRICKFNSDGTLSNTFTAAFNGTIAQKIAVNKDDKLLVIGDFSTVTPTGGGAVSQANIALLNSDGTLSGVVSNSGLSTPTGVYSNIKAICAVTDGAFLLAGALYHSNQGYGVLKLTATGGWPASPAWTGPMVNYSNWGARNIYTIKPLRDGRAVIGGTFNTADFSGSQLWNKNRLAILATNGLVVSEFIPRLFHYQLGSTDGLGFVADVEQMRSGDLFIVGQFTGVDNGLGGNQGMTIFDLTGNTPQLIMTEGYTVPTSGHTTNKVMLTANDEPIIFRSATPFSVTPTFCTYNNFTPTTYTPAIPVSFTGVGKFKFVEVPEGYAGPLRLNLCYGTAISTNIAGVNKFTVNNSDPTLASAALANPGSISLNQTGGVFPTLKIRPAKPFFAGSADTTSGFKIGELVTSTYTWIQVATPVASPTGGGVVYGSTVVLTCATAGASIYYTTDGSTPDNTDTLYTGPITISADTTLKAIGYKTNYEPSDVLTETYTQVTLDPPDALPVGSSLLATTPIYLYHEQLGDLTPNMTTNSAPSGTVSASYGGSTAWQAFDGSSLTYWDASGTSFPVTLSYQFPAAKKVYTVKVTTQNTTNLTVTIQGSNNGSSWTSLTAAEGRAFTAGQPETFKLLVVGSYTYYRLYFNTGNTYVFLTNVELFGGVDVYYTVDGSSPDLVNRVPVKTTNSIESGWTSSASSESTGFEAWKAFDNDTGTSWLANTANLVPQSLTAQKSTAETISAYAVTADTYVGAPKDFKLQGSNNGSSWTDLDTRTGITWSGTERKQYAVGSPAAYTYYRLYITAVQDNAYEPAVIRLELLRYGTAYAAPHTFTTGVTMKAVAVQTGAITSSIMEEVYTQTQVATPVATPGAGAVAFGSTVALTCATSGATIRYTVDGTEPDPNATGYGTDLIPQMTGYTSPSGSASQSSYGTNSGVYLVGWKAMDNGTSAFPPIWQANGPVPQWISYDFGSSTTVAGYSITVWSDLTHVPTTFTLQYSSDGSTWWDLNTRTVSWTPSEKKTWSVTPTAARYWRIYVTACGSNYCTIAEMELLGPAGSTLIYSTPITVSAPVTIKALGTKTNYATSNTLTAAYTQAQLADVTFNPVGGTSGASLITLTQATSGSTIRYTIDGSTPTISNGFTYSGPFVIVAPKTVKAYAYKTGYIDSNVSTATYP